MTERPLVAQRCHSTSTAIRMVLPVLLPEKMIFVEVSDV